MVTLVNQSSPFLDTVVLDVIGTWSCIISDQLEYQVTMCGPNELEFLLVSVHNTNNVNEKVYIGLWYRPPAN